MQDIRIPRASGPVVKTAAKQECTAEGPGFESRLVHFYSSWGLLGCLFVPPRTNLNPSGASWASREEPPGAPQEPPGAPQEPPGEPQEAPEKRPEGAPKAPWRAKGPRGPLALQGAFGAPSGRFSGASWGSPGGSWGAPGGSWGAPGGSSREAQEAPEGFKLVLGGTKRHPRRPHEL